MGRPKANSSLAEKEMDKAEKQFEDFDNQVKALTKDHMDKAPLKEEEPQTKLSQKEIAKSQDIYLKPKRSIAAADKFNEKFRDKYNFDKEYVKFIAENKEIIGETIELWTRPYGGMPAEFWEVPTNKPIWGPRYLAEQIRRKTYHRLSMDNRAVHSQAEGTYYGNIVVDDTIKRLSAEPVVDRQSVFLSQKDF